MMFKSFRNPLLVLCCFFMAITIIVSGNFNSQNNEVTSIGSRRACCNLPLDVVQDIANYANVTNYILDSFVNGTFKGFAWNSLADFVDKFGNRLVGTENLEKAIDYMVQLLKNNNLENVHTESVEVPYWIRGKESATLLEPRVKNMPLLGLGYSVGTQLEGLIAQAVVVDSFEELNTLSKDYVRGKIVVYDEGFVSYDKTVVYRSKAASEASKKGAIAALIRSITPFSIASPHTGAQSYEANVTKIPVAAITTEDADLLMRLYKKKTKIVIHLKMSATLEQRISRNTIAELTGSEMKDKVVVVSGHIDSWDVGEGAMDDGGGVFISWIAPKVLKELNLRPKRTLRTILWTGEELGLIGGKAYEKRHRQENENFNFVMESDAGTFSPQGLTYSGSKKGECMMREILKLFSSINATKLELGDPGPDITYMVEKGIPGGGLLNANEKYFWFHHSEGDTMNVIDSGALDRCAGFWTAFSYIVADLKHPIPRN